LRVLQATNLANKTQIEYSTGMFVNCLKPGN
jgi:hypothetical protein